MKFITSSILGFLLKENSSSSSSWNNPSRVINPCNMINNNNSNVDMKRKQQSRLMVGKASNRSGVHGSHLPTTPILDNVEEMEKNIKKGKKGKEEKRKQVEESVDSRLKQRSGQLPKSSAED